MSREVTPRAKVFRGEQTGGKGPKLSDADIAEMSTGLPSEPCGGCGARGWCGHRGRIDPALPRREVTRPRTPLLIEMLAAAWGWVPAQ